MKNFFLNLITMRRWTLLDEIIKHIENAVVKEIANYKDNQYTEPDVELMINAETEHLRKENRKLMKRDYPGLLIEIEEEQFLCPVCRNKVENPDYKFCPECGKRIIRSHPFK